MPGALVKWGHSEQDKENYYNDKSTFRLPRQHLPLPHGGIHHESAHPQSRMREGDHRGLCRSDHGRDRKRYVPAKRMLAKKGIPFSPRRARLITASDYARADYILCMDEENLTDLARLTCGDPEKKVSLLLSWAGRRAEVADPWYTGNFEETYEDILEGCEALLKSINRQGVAGSC